MDSTVVLTSICAAKQHVTCRPVAKDNFQLLGVICAHVAKVVQRECVADGWVVVERTAQAFCVVACACAAGVVGESTTGVCDKLIDVCVGGLADDEIVGLEGFGYYKRIETEKEFVGFVGKVWKRVYGEGAAFCEGDEDIFVIVYRRDDLRNVRLVIFDDDGEFLLDRRPLSYLALGGAYREEVFADWRRLLC